MNRLLHALVVATLSLCLLATPALASNVVVRVNPKVEFFAIMSRLAGYQEYVNTGFATYDAAVDSHFAPFRSHPAIEELRSLRKEASVSYNMPAELALALAPDSWELRVQPGSPETGLDERWTVEAASRFLAAARQLWDASDADAFFADQQEFYRSTESALAQGIHGRIDTTWLAQQYGDQVRPFTIVPGLLNGPHSYGPHLNYPDGRTEAFAVLATPSHEAGQSPSYPVAQVASLLVHEMHHPYVNPWVKSQARALELPASALFNVAQGAMKAAAYGRWDHMVNESIVRAQVLRYYRSRGDMGAYWRNLRDDRARGFAWVDALADDLDAAAGVAGPFDARAAEAVVAFFQRWSHDPAAMIAAEDQRQHDRQVARRAAGVQILAATPALEGGRAAVGEGELRLRFDRPMKGSVHIDGNVPEVTGNPRWENESSELVVPVRFAAGERYILQLNEELSPDIGFVGKDGEWLIPREWRIEVVDTEQGDPNP